LIYLLDTCVISELIKPEPEAKVASWLLMQREESLFLSVITIGEIQKGISKLSKESRRKNELLSWLDSELLPRFHNRILGIDVHVARKWGEIQATAEKSGIKMPLIDSLIAAIGLVYGMTVVTRNTDDMIASKVGLYNPWQ
jgi:predicted nucleic acid-binding protein